MMIRIRDRRGYVLCTAGADAGERRRGFAMIRGGTTGLMGKVFAIIGRVSLHVPTAKYFYWHSVLIWL